MENTIVNTILSTFHKIIDVYPSDKNDTEIFKKHLSHEKICEAVEWWINSFKKQIQYDYTIDIFHTMQESGVGILIKFEFWDLRIGIQIKSYGDINDEKFYKNSLAKIQESHSHNLKMLVLVLCGEKNNLSQLHRMRHPKSKISQQMTDYIKILEPEKALTIYNVFLNKEDPLEHIQSNIISELDSLQSVRENGNKYFFKNETSIYNSSLKEPSEKEINQYIFEIESSSDENKER